MTDKEKGITVTPFDITRKALGQTLLGRAQAFTAVKNVSEAGRLQAIRDLKTDALYKEVVVPAANGKGVTCCTFKEFCRLGLKQSYEKTREDLKLLDTFGPEVLDTMKDVSVGYRDIRKLQKMPDEDIAEFRGKVVNLNDKDDIRELVDDVLIAHERAKSDLEESQADLVNARTNLDTARIQINILENNPKPVASNWSDPVLEIREESSAGYLLINSQFDELDRLIGLLASPLEIPDSFDRTEQMQAGGRVLHTHLKSLQARATQMLHVFNEHLGNLGVSSPDDLPYMNLTEAESAHADCRVMLHSAEVYKNDRAKLRELRKPKGPGRPKGSKNKS